ncbi:MAG: PAS domain S-box protein [bacterium]|nr:PAS domain S-box protein [bacterium]
MGAFSQPLKLHLQPPPRPLPLVVRYGNAFIFTSLALALTFVLRENLRTSIFLFFNFALVLSAFFGGFGPGMLSAVLGLVMVEYYLVEPIFAFGSIDDPSRLLQSLLFLAIGVVMSWSQDLRLRIEKRLENTTRELEAILGSIGDAVTAQDVNGRIMFANQAAADLNGFTTVPELLRNSITGLQQRAEIYDENNQPLSFHNVPRVHVFRGEGPNETIMRIVRKEQGLDRWFSVRAAPVTDAKGYVRLAVTVTRDITAIRESQKQLMDLALQVERQRQRLNTVIANIPAIIWEIGGSEGAARVEFVNEYAEKLLGYPMHRWQTTPDIWNELVHPDDQERNRADFERMIQTGKPVISQFRALHQDGSIVHLEAHSQITLTGESEGRLYSVMMDVSERIKARQELEARAEALRLANLELQRLNDELMRNERQLRHLTSKIDQQRRRLHNVVANVPMIIWEGTDGRPGQGQQINYLNSAAEAILGYPMNDWQAGKVNWRDVVVPDDWEALIERSNAIYQERGSGMVQFRARHHDGRVVHLEAHTSVIGDGDDSPAAYGVFIDVTERIRNQQALAEQAEHLRQVNHELSQFAYIASHDLQEPLRMVTSYLQLLENRYGDKLDQDAHDFIGFAVDGAARMKGLITDLLTYSRVSRTQEAFAPVKLDTVFERVCSNLQIAIEESGAAVTADPLPTVWGHANQLTQLLQNLVGNALKFRGQPAPRIHIGVEENALAYTFCVSDNGIGIDPQFKDRIFTMFQRLHSRDEYPGTGIGLAICKKVIENHGGKIWVESALGSGTTFYFTLPHHRTGA